MNKRDCFEYGHKLPVAVTKRYQRTVDSWSYLLIYESQMYGDDVMCKIQKMPKILAVGMKDKAFNGNDAISVINSFTECKRALDSSRIYERAPI